MFVVFVFSLDKEDCFLVQVSFLFFFNVFNRWYLLHLHFYFNLVFVYPLISYQNRCLPFLPCADFPIKVDICNFSIFTFIYIISRTSDDLERKSLTDREEKLLSWKDGHEWEERSNSFFHFQVFIQKGNFSFLLFLSNHCLFVCVNVKIRVCFDFCVAKELLPLGIGFNFVLFRNTHNNVLIYWNLQRLRLEWIYLYAHFKRNRSSFIHHPQNSFTFKRRGCNEKFIAWMEAVPNLKRVVINWQFRFFISNLHIKLESWTCNHIEREGWDYLKPFMNEEYNFVFYLLIVIFDTANL